MVRQILLCFFRNRQTGAITVAQAPNLPLWIAIVAGILRWLWSPSGNFGLALYGRLQGRPDRMGDRRDFSGR